jgi:Undecaprenyl-phosphate glucose phosphotransferase
MLNNAHQHSRSPWDAFSTHVPKQRALWPGPRRIQPPAGNPGTWHEAQRTREAFRSDRCICKLVNQQAYGIEASLFDSGVIVFASVASGAGYHLWSAGRPADMSVSVGAGILLSLLFYGVSRPRALKVPFGASKAGQRARDGLSSWIIAFALFLFVVVSMRISTGLPAGGLLAFFLTGLVAVTISRIEAPLLLARAFKRSLLEGTIVIGPRNNPRFSRLMDDLREASRCEPLPVVFDAICTDDAWPQEAKRTFNHARRLAHNAGPGKILVQGHGLSKDRLNILVAELAVLPRAICVVPDESISSLLSQKRTIVGDHLALEIQAAPLNMVQRALKRALDIAVASSLLLVLTPFFAAIAVLIKCESAGPVFFQQARTGYRGQIFRIFKFRSMAVLEDGPVILQAQKGDSRVTRIGQLLRRSSLDELPQLLNVLMGDMSLVGPRPHAVAHDKSYANQIPDYMMRQHVLPGITGWAQVNGFRGETSTVDAMRRRVEHDIWYAKNCSLLLDLRIMARTLFVIARAHNAY